MAFSHDMKNGAKTASLSRASGAWFFGALARAMPLTFGCEGRKERAKKNRRNGTLRSYGFQ
jgi:hypothetical protein